MKRTLLLAIYLLSVICGEVFPQLKLESKIVSQYYCRGDADLDRLTLNLNLKYTNVGSETIILSRDSSEIGQMLVSMDDNGVIGKREASPVFTWMSSGKRTATTADWNRLFVTLKPKETYETKTVAGIFVFRENSSDIDGGVGNGKHFLQLRVSNWYGSAENADQLQKSWKNRGKLWTDSIMSEPMRFTVVPKRRLVKCR